MGKYMKKSKITADVAVMEVPPRPFNGVRTRAAKTLALQRLQRPSHSPSPISNPDVVSSSYLELRSRRLEKLPLLEQQNVRQSFQRKTEESSGCCRKRLKSSNCRPNSKLRSDSFEPEAVSTVYEKDEVEVGFHVQVEDNRNLASVKPSCVVSHLELDEGNGSTVGTDMHTSLPTSDEVEEFFTLAERKQQRLFIEKYNFDIFKDVPLSGRYEWVELVP